MIVVSYLVALWLAIGVLALFITIAAATITAIDALRDRPLLGPRCWLIGRRCLAGALPVGGWRDWLFWRRCWRRTADGRCFCAHHLNDGDGQ